MMTLCHGNINWSICHLDVSGASSNHMANCFQDGQILSSDPALLFHSLVFGLNINVISEFHVKRTGGSTILSLHFFIFLQVNT
jgi:hypothetical protein